MSADRATAATPTWVIATVSGLFGLAHAFLVFQSVTLLVTQANGPLGLNGLGWTVLTAAALVPVLAFAVAFAIAWRRTAGILALVMLAGLGVAAVFWLNVVSYAYANGATLLGG